MSDSPILIVDDDEALCRALAASLRRRGEKTVLAHSIAEAQAEAQAWSVERAVVDLRIQDESGLDLIPQLRQLDAEMSIVVLTGFGTISTAVEAIKLGAAQYLTKPVGAGDILQAFAGHAPEVLAEAAAPSLEQVEWEHLQRVLKEAEGNISEAARRLKMHRRTLQRKLARYRP
ncbi:MAG: response regulator [Polyangiaceae bacterium]|nr:response regulator [Polyangiaceae bacterium]